MELNYSLLYMLYYIYSQVHLMYQNLLLRSILNKRLRTLRDSIYFI